MATIDKVPTINADDNDDDDDDEDDVAVGGEASPWGKDGDALHRGTVGTEQLRTGQRTGYASQGTQEEPKRAEEGRRGPKRAERESYQLKLSRSEPKTRFEAPEPELSVVEPRQLLTPTILLHVKSSPGGPVSSILRLTWTKRGNGASDER
ncbi:GL27051 [Drosophila persimilis]|uniref:GL27051 n=1 Tax=Drosophila persimilis TaxID=7234 RepID=B4HAR0_DROPE|nr:GL27051 [Drosophila persimilis]